jgi:tRNA threonylcarbamoyladenosine biosynthesis protein TsaB
VSWLLNIDTAVTSASVCLSRNDVKLGIKINSSKNDHAAWLQPSIATLLREHDLTVKNLDAISVSAGPGSYTGLRVGMATAKGLCYAYQTPLILINTLQMMAAALTNETADLLCPMIDARRMEVFTAVFDRSLKTILEPHNCVLSDHSFMNLLSEHRIVFFGNGSEKFKSMVFHPNAIFKQLEVTAEQMVSLTYRSYVNKDFADLAYSEPLYGKEFFSPAFRKAKNI